MKLYKFVSKEHLDGFFESGSLRLPTIYSFRDTIEHGQSRSDEGEGRHKLSRTVVGDPIELDTLEPIISELFGGKAMPNVFIKDIKCKVERRSPDAFIFCTSYHFSQALFLRWFREEGTDACYEIAGPAKFFRAISDKIESSAKFQVFANVAYIGEDIDYRSPQANAFPGLTKAREEYGWQFENRAIWSARGPCGPLKPWIVNVPDAVSFCRPYASIQEGIVKRVEKR